MTARFPQGGFKARVVASAFAAYVLALLATLFVPDRAEVWQALFGIYAGCAVAGLGARAGEQFIVGRMGGRGDEPPPGSGPP